MEGAKRIGTFFNYFGKILLVRFITHKSIASCIFVVLKKAVAITVALCFLLVQTPLQQFMRIPVLYAHFIKHKKMEPGMDFEEFIALHYSTHSTQDLDHEEDAQLPFKCPDLHFPTQMNIATENCGHFTVIPAISIKKSYCITEVTSLPAPYLSEVFQPPKAA